MDKQQQEHKQQNSQKQVQKKQKKKIKQQNKNQKQEDVNKKGKSKKQDRKQDKQEKEDKGNREDNNQQQWQSFDSQQGNEQSIENQLNLPPRVEQAYQMLLQQFGSGSNSQSQPQQYDEQQQQLEEQISNIIQKKNQHKEELNQKQHTLGCEHYIRNCLVQAPCCKIYYSCKLCHDQKYQGPKSKGCKVQRMQFDKVQHIQCLKCQKIQQPSIKCSNPQCQIQFGKYTCLKCKLYQNKPAKANDIFHCDECKMCRRGKVQDFYHCKICGYCRPLSDKNNHKCSENIAQSQCPICLQVLKYSVKFYQKLPCGHLIHVKCYQQYRGLNCPVCGMATQKLSQQMNKQIQQQVEQTRQHLPKQLIDKKVNVMCNQCLFKTIDAPFHFLGIKCQGCGSFNTKLI